MADADEATTESRLATLEARLNRFEHEREIVRTLYAYGHAIDYGDHDAWLDCFVDDGVYDVRWRDRPPVLAKGRAQLWAFIVAHTFAPHVWHKHFLVEPQITLLDGDHADVRSYFARLDENDGGVVVRAFGRYLDRMRSCSDGRWRFSERIVEVDVSMSRAVPLSDR